MSSNHLIVPHFVHSKHEMLRRNIFLSLVQSPSEAREPRCYSAHLLTIMRCTFSQQTTSTSSQQGKNWNKILANLGTWCLSKILQTLLLFIHFLKFLLDSLPFFLVISFYISHLVQLCGTEGQVDGPIHSRREKHVGLIGAYQMDLPQALHTILTLNFLNDSLKDKNMYGGENWPLSQHTHSISLFSYWRKLAHRSLSSLCGGKGALRHERGQHNDQQRSSQKIWLFWICLSRLINQLGLLHVDGSCGDDPLAQFYRSWQDAITGSDTSTLKLTNVRDVDTTDSVHTYSERELCGQGVSY